MEIIYQKQIWKDHDRYLILEKESLSSCQLIVYPEENPGIFALYVTPEYRNKGIAKALLGKAEEILKDLEKEEVLLNWEGNESEEYIPKFYMKLGYIPKRIEFSKKL